MEAGKRLSKELRENSKAKADTGIELVPSDSNIYLWRAFIRGPPETPFEEGVFELLITVPKSYPLSAPLVRFKTKIFHPNIHWKTGEVCLDILKTAWSPAWTLYSVCQAIAVLLSNGASDSPLNCDAGNLLRANDYIGYNSVARMYTLEHAQEHLNRAKQK